MVRPPDARTEGRPLVDGIDEDGGIDTILKQMINSFAKNQTPRFPMPQRSGCASVEVEKHKTRDNSGTMACHSRCKLVYILLQGALLSVLVPLFPRRSFRNARNIVGAFISGVRANNLMAPPGTDALASQ